MPSQKTTKKAKPEPIGNRWGPVAPPRQPDLRWTHAITSLEVTRDTLPEDFCDRPTLPSPGVVQAPPKAPMPVGAINGVVSGVDERLAEKVDERLAESKAFDEEVES